MVNNVAYNAISRLYNQRTLEKMKALATGELLLEETQEAGKEVEEGLEGDTDIVVEEKIEVRSTETQELIETSIAEEDEDDTEVVVEEKLEVELSETEGEENPKE